FGNAIDGATLARVHALASRLGAQRMPGVVDIVPAYASLGVYFDLQRVGADAVAVWIGEALRAADTDYAETPAREVEIPVAYGGAFGPDLDEAAASLGISADELAAQHAAV